MPAKGEYMRKGLCVLVALALALVTLQVHAQAYPVKPVRIVVTYPPGGSTDAIGRILTPHLAERFGQPFILDNRPGGGATIGTDLVAKSPGDGYTLLITGTLVLIPVITSKLPYDALRDFAPITLLVTSPMMVAVNPSLLPVKSIQELIPLLKSKPGLPFASGGPGMQLAGELFKLLTGVDMTHVPYKGAGQALTDLAGGQLAIAFTDLGSTTRFLKSGRIRVLAVASATRSANAPDIPTGAESGLPGWQSLGSFGLLAPSATPAPIVQRLNAEVTALLRKPDIRERILATGNEPAPRTPEEFSRFIATELPRWTKVIKEAGLKFE